MGNIAWQTSQDELQELFSRVGESKFEIHREKGSNRPSGYGFVDFKDPQAAAQAIQKFNGLEINGRELNVDYPSQTNSNRGGASSSASSSKASTFAQSKVRDIQRQPPMKAGPGTTSQKVNNVMESMSTAEIYDIMMSIKEDPEQGRRHLQTNPSLAYALLQAQVILGFIPTEKASSYFVGYEASSSNAMAVDAPQAAPSQPVAQPSYSLPAATPPPAFSYGTPPPQPVQARPPAAHPPLAELVRMPPQALAHFNLPDQFKTLINIVHTWSARSTTDFENLKPEQMAQIRRIFEEAQVPLPTRR